MNKRWLCSILPTADLHQARCTIPHTRNMGVLSAPSHMACLVGSSTRVAVSFHAHTHAHSIDAAMSCTHKHTHARTQARTHARTHSHTHTHTHTHTRMHARTNTHTQTHTNTHAHTHTHTHTHAHTHTAIKDKRCCRCRKRLARPLKTYGRCSRMRVYVQPYVKNLSHMLQHR